MKTFKQVLIISVFACLVFFEHDIFAQTATDSTYPADLEASILLAKSYFDKGSYEEALKGFEKIAQADNSKLKDNALYWCGESNFKMARYDNAISYYKKVIDAYPLSSYVPYAYYSRGWAYYEKDEPGLALKDLQKIEDDYPDSKILPSALYKMAEILYGLSMLEKAKEKIGLYIEKFPLATESKDALFLKGEIMYQLGDYEEAVSAYRYSLKLTGNRPWTPYAYLGIAWSFFNMGRYNQAIEEFKVVLDKETLEDYKENALFGMALCYSMKGEHDKALPIYDKLIYSHEAGYYTEQAYLKKSELLYSLSRFEEAKLCYNSFLEQFPGSTFTAEVYYRMALIMLDLDENLQAVDFFENAKVASKDLNLKANAVCMIADIYASIDDYKNAQRYYDEILNIYPNSAYADYAQYNLGLMFIRLGELDNAVIALNSMIGNFPDSKLLDKATFELANIYYSQGHYELALKEYYNIINNIKDSSLTDMARYKIGLYFYSKSDYSKAIEIFKNIIDIAHDKDAERLARYELGWCYYRMGREDLAIGIFDDYIIRYPEGDMTADVIYWFAQYYYSKGSYGRVRISLKRISEGFPDSGLKDKVEYLLGWTLYREGKIPEALKKFEYLIISYPDTDAAERAVVSIGDVFMELGRNNDGIRVLNGVLQITESKRLQRAAHKKIGLIYQSQGLYNMAIDSYRKAITNESSDFNAELQFIIAQCLEDESYFDDAVSEYLKVCYLYPNIRHWVVKARLRVAHIFEFQGKWDEAKKIYEEIALEGNEESKYAQEKLLWIDRHRDEL
jgi:tetratricopeptide (TPR) repeat protein